MEISTFVFLSKLFWIKLTSVVFMKINCSQNTLISLYFNMVSLIIHLLKYSHISGWIVSKCQTGMCFTEVVKSYIYFKIFSINSFFHSSKLHCTKMTKHDFHKLLAHTYWKHLEGLKTNPVFVCVCMLQRISEQEIQIISTPEKHSTLFPKGSRLDWFKVTV